MNQAIQEFISANSRITQSYFAFTEKVLTLLGNEPNKHQVLLQLLAQTENITQTFLAAQQQLLTGDALLPYGEARGLPKQTVAMIKEPSGISPALPVHAEENMEVWLRQQLADITGFTDTELDMTLDFDQLGLDSLTLLDLQEALTQRCPEAAKINLYESKTPIKLLASLAQLSPVKKEHDGVFSANAVLREIISRITGFTFDDIDLSLTFDELGLDSLGRLDILEALQSEHPEVKPYAQRLTNLQSPGEMIALLEEHLASGTHETALESSLFQLLHKFGSVNGNNIDREAPFESYLADGFIRAAVWENLAQHYSVCHFAGEALMSRRNVNDALALLNRVG